MSFRLALFDFDGTLTTGDTLLPFLRHFTGNAKFFTRLVLLSPVLACFVMGLIRNDVAKQSVLKKFMAGRHLDEVQRAGERFSLEGMTRLLRPDMMERMRWHLSQGHCCVLVSASLDVYLHPWAERVGFEALLCSRLSVTPEGLVTGDLEGANCFGEEKSKRISAWLNGRQPAYIYAYGDSRGDREMLAMADEGYLCGELVSKVAR